MSDKHNLHVSRNRFLGALKRVLGRVYRDVPEMSKALSLWSQIRQDTVHFMALSHDTIGMYSYAREKDARYDVPHRIKSSFGKIVKKLYNPEWMRPETFGIIANKLTPIIWPGEEGKFFTVVTGEGVMEAYRHSFAQSSCMTGQQAQDWLELYHDNPDKVAMVKYNDGHTTARALLWTTDQGTKVLDRIYTLKGNLQLLAEKYHIWCDENQYAYRDNAGSRAHKECVFSGKKNDYTVTVPRPEYMPYMDTFLYGKLEEIGGESMLILSTQSPACNYRYEFSHLYGDYDGTHSENECVHCGHGMNDDDCYYIGDGGPYCESCYNDHSSYCHYCEEVFWSEDVAVVDGDTWCPTCARDHAWYCEHCDAYHSEDTECFNLHDRNYCPQAFDDNVIGTCEECGRVVMCTDIIEWEEDDETHCTCKGCTPRRHLPSGDPVDKIVTQADPPAPKPAEPPVMADLTPARVLRECQRRRPDMGWSLGMRNTINVVSHTPDRAIEVGHIGGNASLEWAYHLGGVDDWVRFPTQATLIEGFFTELERVWPSPTPVILTPAQLLAEFRRRRPDKDWMFNGNNRQGVCIDYTVLSYRPDYGEIACPVDDRGWRYWIRQEPTRCAPTQAQAIEAFFEAYKLANPIVATARDAITANA